MKTEGKDTSKLEDLVKKAVYEGEKKKNAAAQEWEALFEGSRVAGEPEITPKTAAIMIGKMVTAGAWALKETGAMHLNDKQVLFDFTKKMWSNGRCCRHISVCT